jgi:hypothetical protein
MERYPENTNACLEDFRKCGWRPALDSRTREGYGSMWQSLSSAAKQTIEGGKTAEGKVLWLLADACSMMLQPTSLNEPFMPFMMTASGRSALPEDFEGSDVTLFSQIIEEIDDLWLKARLADLVWLLQHPRNSKFALLAIDSYRTIPLDMETWQHNGMECWERALGLSIMLGKGAANRLSEIEVTLITSLENATTKNEFLPLGLADMLAKYRLGQTKRLDIAKKLEDLARGFDTEGDLHYAREYFDASASWFHKASDKAKAAEMTVQVAEGWVKEAIARMSSEQPSYMVATGFFEKAIHKYRSIPKTERTVHKVDERIAEIRVEMSAAGEKSLGEMGAITSSSIDITELIERARSTVRGKSAFDALAAFANIYRGVRVTQLREFSAKMLREHPLQAFISATHLSRDGRVIAKRPGINPSDPTADENEKAVWAEMIKYYSIEVSFIVQGHIWSALEVLQLEHRLREADFIRIASQSPIVPHGREQLFGKALFAGYDKDFVSALHLLIPQLEHLVRWHLKSRGVKTTTLDPNGIENENGLSALMELPETKQIFGEDVTFELRALFCDAFGPNLRNELAHGLLDKEECESVAAIYAWWFGLRIVFNTFLNARKEPAVTGDEG